MPKCPILLACALALAGCASIPHAGCPAGLRPAQTAEMIFGRNIGGSPGVSDADWTGFADTEITPRFPDGFTVLDANGQWHARNGTTVHERSKVLLIVSSGSSDFEQKLADIRQAYRERFRQESVLLLVGRECVGF
jgi:hypothetical protein